MMHNVPRKITQKVQKTELPFLHSARYFRLIDICIKFREYSLSGFQVIEIFLKHKIPRQITQKYKRQSYHSCTLHVISC